MLNEDSKITYFNQSYREKVYSKENKLSKLEIENFSQIKFRNEADTMIGFGVKPRFQEQKKNQKSPRIDYTLSKLSKLYKFDSIDELVKFLSKNKNIASTLLDIYDDIRKMFPTEEIKLKVVSDMEVSDTEELFAYIFTKLPAKEAVEKLETLEYKLLPEKLKNISGAFTFNLRFI